MSNGLFITFEGGEGSGKTTVVNGLKEKLLKDGYHVVITREPGGCSLAEEIREMILKDYDYHPLTTAGLFASARKQHCTEVIEPALKNKSIVLSDRYIHSNMVYQGYTNYGVDGFDMIYKINKAMDVTIPDITFFLDIVPEKGLQRIQKNGREINSYDLKGLDFHNKVYEGYKAIQSGLGPMHNKFYEIDASKDRYENIIEEIYEKIKEEISKAEKG